LDRGHARAAALLLALACTGVTGACARPGGDPAGSGASGEAAASAAQAAAQGQGATAATTPADGTPTDGTVPASASAGSPGSLASSEVTGSAAAVASGGPGTPTAPAAAGTSLRGKVVVIDPGHNGGNSRHTSQIARKVEIGNGSKACDTTGTETNAGYAESAFTFDVSTRLAALLRAQGATVVLTRADDRGVGPCINQRAAVGNEAHADAAISIHGDGAAAAGHGFHVIVPHGIGSNDAIVAPSRRLGTQVRDAFRAGTGEGLSTYTGTRTGGLVSRDDLGGLNLSQVPKVFIECGNMRNAVDARQMTTAAWRQRAAAALAVGITRFLAG